MYTTPPDDVTAGISEPKTHAAGSSYRNIPDTRSISMLGLGMVIGAVIGAGVALLAAPRSGEDTRDRIRDRVRNVRGRRGVWYQLGRELRRAASARRKRELERRKQEELKILERERAERDARVPPP
jgi:gas vesicle protein